MSLPDGLSLRDADLADIPAILELRREAGWGAHDWALRLAIEPPNARCVLVTDGAEALVAVGSGVAYAPLGFVGNMIVAERFRRRGIGSAVLDEVIEFLESAGCTRLELFATESGRPLYLRHGFGFIEPGSLARIPRGVAPEAPTDSMVVADADPTVLDPLIAYDTPRFGGPRAAQLETIAGDPDRPLLVATRGGAIAGFGWLRADGDRIGPWLADDPEVATAILSEAFRRLPDREELTANIPMSNHGGVNWLRGLGVEPDPWDGRMARGAPIAMRQETIYGNTVGALG